jgi:hypothetical protein
MDNEEASMIAFGLLGGALFVGRYTVRGDRRALLTAGSFISFGTTAAIGGIRILKNPQFKTNTKRNITKGVGVSTIGVGLGLVGLSIMYMTNNNPYPGLTDVTAYGGAIALIGGTAAISVANDIANVVKWEGSGKDFLPWWSI